MSLKDYTYGYKWKPESCSTFCLWEAFEVYNSFFRRGGGGGGVWMQLGLPTRFVTAEDVTGFPYVILGLPLNLPWRGGKKNKVKKWGNIKSLELIILVFVSFFSWINAENFPIDNEGPIC